MFSYLLLLPTLTVAQHHSSFLQIKDADTSLGLLGEGLEAINSNIEDFGNFFNDSINNLYSQV